MNQTYLKIAILIVFICNCMSTDPPSSTPSVWIENLYTSACSAIGTPKIAQNQNTAVELNPTYTYLKSSHAYASYIISDKQIYTQKIFKYYIRMEDGGDGIFYLLQMSLISPTDGSKQTQTKTIPNTHEFISASGQYCLLKQGNNLVLYSFNQAEGATELVLNSTKDVSAYPNEIFKQIRFGENDVEAPGYSGIKGQLISIDTVSNKIIVRSIRQSGIGSEMFRFTMNNLNSQVYTNMLFGLQIYVTSQETSFFTYLFPNLGFPPYVYKLDSTALSTLSAGPFSNNIVVKFSQSMMVTTYDDSGQNGHIFFLKSDVQGQNCVFSLINMKTTLDETAGNLHYLTDYTSYIIELNVNPEVSSFYIFWAENQDMSYLAFQNHVGDENNAQIIADFLNQQKISSFIYAFYSYEDSSYTSDIYLWIMTSNKIVKYVLQKKNNQNNIQVIAINKEFSVDLVGNLLVNSVSLNFQVTTQLKCSCQVTEITDMICFYGTDACTFTVQTYFQYCTPEIAN